MNYSEIRENTPVLNSTELARVVDNWSSDMCQTEALFVRLPDAIGIRSMRIIYDERLIKKLSSTHYDFKCEQEALYTAEERKVVIPDCPRLSSEPPVSGYKNKKYLMETVAPWFEHCMQLLSSYADSFTGSQRNEHMFCELIPDTLRIPWRDPQQQGLFYLQDQSSW